MNAVPWLIGLSIAVGAQSVVNGYLLSIVRNNRKENDSQWACYRYLYVRMGLMESRLNLAMQLMRMTRKR